MKKKDPEKLTRNIYELCKNKVRGRGNTRKQGSKVGGRKVGVTGTGACRNRRGRVCTQGRVRIALGIKKEWKNLLKMHDLVQWGRGVRRGGRGYRQANM